LWYSIDFGDKELWDTYNEVNNEFSKAIIEIGGDSDLIWIHDSHLLTTPHFLVRKNSYANIGLFVHSCFPSAEFYKIFPYRYEVFFSLFFI
jgi:trehalose 6-phosphate synthase/phosphatase